MVTMYHLPCAKEPEGLPLTRGDGPAEEPHPRHPHEPGMYRLGSQHSP